MEANIIESLLLNIGDKLKLKVPGFCYRYEDDTKSVFETGYNKDPKDGWIPCDTLIGNDCGSTNHHNGDELKLIKVRIIDPLKMGDFYKNYIEFYPESIESIEILEKVKGSVMDKICHTLTIEKTTTKS